MCLTEWDFRRVLCPGCGEEDLKQLPIYKTEGLDHVRVEACDTCKRYIKTIDLTVDGRTLPVVDELVSLPLALWAEQKGCNEIAAQRF